MSSTVPSRFIGIDPAIQPKARAWQERLCKRGGKASACRADVADESAMKLMATTAVERYGSLDILCANAGIVPAAKLDVMSGAEFDKVLATNLRGTFLSVSACLLALKRAKGRIVVTSSITGPITGYPGWSHYGASKQANSASFVRPLSSWRRRV